MELTPNPRAAAWCALTDDELLALLAEPEQAQAARDALPLRHYRWAAAHSARLAQRWSLLEDLVADARQEAVLATLEAIRQYNPHHQAGPNGHCTFRTFLQTVVVARFTDWLRKRGRRERRLDRSVNVQKLLSGDGEHSPCTSGWRPVPASPDPAEAAAERELLARLREALDRLPPAARTLLEEAAAGTPLRSLVARLGMSYDCLKRERRRLLGHLAAVLGADKGEAG